MYSDDLAHIHHRGFTRLARGVAPELLRLLQRHGIRAAPRQTTTLVEVGCGSGVLAARLVAAGYDVVGIDQSPAMIRIARSIAPGARFRVARLERARLPPASAVIAVGEIVTYVPGGLQVLRRFFQRVRRALRPGGLFVFDFIDSAERRIYSRRVFEGDDWFSLDSDRAMSWKRVQSIVAQEHDRLADLIEAIDKGAAASALPDAERAELVLGITSHAVYHAGQIQLIKRLQEA